ncbi:unnamed protein product [Linum tenue]|uniref:B3 domain-containing protein n=1 Tax=Linum tenue TaxID=586396 RepID=A0AAV0K5D2_9ROSI|nr:unnamed protein product [Linum tenue]
MVVEEEEEREVAWTIRKVLTKSDTNDCSRLLIANDLARQHVFPYLTAEAAERVESGGCKAEGAADVVVWDVDTGSEHRLQFRRWNSTRGYVFNNEWTGGFVRRRELKEGDEVGLCFDGRRGRFVFSVLKRAAN